MARGKKNEKELTIEERLGQALVPAEEQPYSVPENWCWCKMQAICDFERGITFPASAKQMAETDSNIPCLRTANVQEKLDLSDLLYIEKKYTKENPAKMVQTGDIIMSSANSYELVGKTSYVTDVPFPMTFGGFLLVIRSKNGYSKYLFYYMRYQFFMGKFMEKSSQTTNIANINTAKIKKYLLPFPPLAEQQRIVDRIESLFAKLDEAKEKAQAVVDGFEARRAAILHKAFTGELTAQWRQENGIPSNCWKDVCFDEVAAVKSNLVDPKDYQDFPHIAPDNIEKKTGVLLEYRTIREDKVKSGKHRFYARQILYSKIRPYLSKIVIADFDGLCSADMYPIETKENTRYLWYYMLSDEFLQQASSAGSRSVLPKINQKELSALRVKITSPDEQKQIVDILDSLFIKEQQAKETAEAVLDQIETMKKSILARAFRGKLGTNDPTEESGVELLKNMLI